MAKASTNAPASGIQSGVKPPHSISNRVAVARNAMATRFEIVLIGENTTSLRAAGEEALNEIERLEAQLSLYRASSEVAHLNARAAREPVPVERGLFRLLEHAKQLSEETDGAFDITVAPLMALWGLMSTRVARTAPPGRTELMKARALVGMHHVELNPQNLTVRYTRPGVMLDLGAIGKGHAIDQAAELLRDAGVSHALVHGGTSTVSAIGGPWKVAIAGEVGLDVKGARGGPAKPQIIDAEPAEPQPIATVELTDIALSVSAVWGKSIRIGKKNYGHILDPRTGKPVTTVLLAAVMLPSATETDALSTALLTLGMPGQRKIQALRPAARTLVMDTRYRIASVGITN
jgi:thiamine biosynthesis lipoprotein